MATAIAQDPSLIVVPGSRKPFSVPAAKATTAAAPTAAAPTPPAAAHIASPSTPRSFTIPPASSVTSFSRRKPKNTYQSPSATRAVGLRIEGPLTAGAGGVSPGAHLTKPAEESAIAAGAAAAVLSPKASSVSSSSSTTSQSFDTHTTASGHTVRPRRPSPAVSYSVYHPLGKLATTLPEISPSAYGINISPPPEEVETNPARGSVSSNGRSRRPAARARDAQAGQQQQQPIDAGHSRAGPFAGGSGQQTLAAGSPAGTAPAVTAAASSAPASERKDDKSPRKRRSGGGSSSSSKRKRKDADEDDSGAYAAQPAKRTRNQRGAAAAAAAAAASESGTNSPAIPEAPLPNGDEQQDGESANANKRPERRRTSRRAAAAAAAVAAPRASRTDSHATAGSEDVEMTNGENASSKGSPKAGTASPKSTGEDVLPAIAEEPTAEPQAILEEPKNEAGEPAPEGPKNEGEPQAADVSMEAAVPEATSAPISLPTEDPSPKDNLPAREIEEAVPQTEKTSSSVGPLAPEPAVPSPSADEPPIDPVLMSLAPPAPISAPKAVPAPVPAPVESKPVNDDKEEGELSD